MKAKRLWALVGTTAFLGVLYSAGAQQPTARATARLKDPQGNEVGVVRFTQGEKGVVVSARIQGLAPGEHAFHIHEKAECEMPDFKTAGGHFHPTGAKHGFLNSRGPHAGDLPNIVVGQDSAATIELTTDRITLSEEADNSLLRGEGTAVVIHQDPDDYITDPAGSGGERIACGEILKNEK